MGNERAEPVKAGAEPPALAQPAGERQGVAAETADVGPAPVSGVTSGRPLSVGQVTEVVRDVIRQLAPEELPVFDSVADAWLSDGRRQRRSGKSPGAAVGFGIEEVLLTQLAFPIIAAAVGEVLGDVAEDRVRIWRRAGRRAATAEVKPAGASAGKSSESLARDVLTSQQARALRDACERHARTLGMSPAKAKLLADAVLGSLTSGPGGD